MRDAIRCGELKREKKNLKEPAKALSIGRTLSSKPPNSKSISHAEWMRDVERMRPQLLHIFATFSCIYNSCAMLCDICYFSLFSLRWKKMKLFKLDFKFLSWPQQRGEHLSALREARLSRFFQLLGWQKLLLDVIEEKRETVEECNMDNARVDGWLHRAKVYNVSCNL